MTTTLSAVVAQDLATAVPDEVTRAAAMLAEQLGGVAVLFYGSVLRTQALGDILDFYVLTQVPHRSFVRRLGLRWLWPDVSYHELQVGEQVIRAKVATMPLSTFERAATGALIDTTVWTRFAQPSALVFATGADVGRRVEQAVGQAIQTAARFAAALGPEAGPTDAYWRALLQQTYAAELRVEAPGRELQILSHAPDRYHRLLTLAWSASGIDFARQNDQVQPMLQADQRRSLIRAWRKRASLGRSLNIARLIKAAFTFDGAARYGLWKIERHTGVRVELTPWRERHPILAGPGVLWRVYRTTAR